MSSTGKTSNLRAVVYGAIVLAIIGAVVSLLTFALYPYGSKSQLMWHEFRQQEGLDTVCIGTSLTERAYDPDVVDSLNGTSSFNMCTPAQTLQESYIGLLEATEHHDIKRVYVGLDLWAMWTQQPMSPGRVYLREKWKGDDFFQRFPDLAYALDGSDWMNGPKSINWLFPWTEQRVHFDQVKQNIQMQLDGTPVREAAEINEKGWIYIDRGYANYDAVYDYNASSHILLVDSNMDELQELNLKSLGDICDYCANNGIECFVFMPPMTDFNFIALHDVYQRHSDRIKGVVTDHGAVYFDMNLAAPEVYDPKEEYFGDHEHSNIDGGQAFSEAIGGLLNRYEAGEDMGPLFMSYDEKLASIDQIAIVMLKDSESADGVKLEATCYAGSQVKPEFQFLVAKEGGDFEVVQDFSPSTTCTFEPPEAGMYTVRVNARQQGTDVEYEKYSEHETVLS